MQRRSHTWTQFRNSKKSFKVDWDRVENYSVVRLIEFCISVLEIMGWILQTKEERNHPAWYQCLSSKSCIWTDVPAVQTFHLLKTFGASWNAKYDKQLKSFLRQECGIIPLLRVQQLVSSVPRCLQDSDEHISTFDMFSVFDCEQNIGLWDLEIALCFIHIYTVSHLFWDRVWTLNKTRD